VVVSVAISNLASLNMELQAKRKEHEFVRQNSKNVIALQVNLLLSSGRTSLIIVRVTAILILFNPIVPKY
jgi:hypothetical protein